MAGKQLQHLPRYATTPLGVGRQHKHCWLTFSSMIDEPRRSVRATKGQHTKIDLLDQPVEPKLFDASAVLLSKATTRANHGLLAIIVACGNITFASVSVHTLKISQKTTITSARNVVRDFISLFLKGSRKARSSGKSVVESTRRRSLKRSKGRRRARRRESERVIRNPSSAKSPSTPVTVEKKEKKETVARAGSTKRKARDDSQDKDAAKVCLAGLHISTRC
jgi:hypothetical protein